FAHGAGVKAGNPDVLRFLDSLKVEKGAAVAVDPKKEGPKPPPPPPKPGAPYLATKLHPTPIELVAYSPDGQTLYTVSGDGTVKTWDPATLAEKGAHPPPAGRKLFNALALSPDFKLLIASGDKGIELFEVATGAVRAALAPSDLSSMPRAAFTPD